jgi:O-acetyl-ADP-ribose deacetylase (regulator of RNase III)
MKLAEQVGVGSIAFPVLGAGSGGYDAKRAESIMIAAFHEIESAIEVTVVRFKKQ